MLKGMKPLSAAALCLIGLATFAQNASASQWVETGRSAYLKRSFFGSYDEHTCNLGAAPIFGYPGSCANDAVTGWSANYNASNALANEQLNACGVNPFELGSLCYGLAHGINGQDYDGGLPAAGVPTTCTVGTIAVVTSASSETVEVEYGELDVDTIIHSIEYVCQ